MKMSIFLLIFFSVPQTPIFSEPPGRPARLICLCDYGRRHPSLPWTKILIIICSLQGWTGAGGLIPGVHRAMVSWKKNRSRLLQYLPGLFWLRHIAITLLALWPVGNKAYKDLWFICSLQSQKKICHEPMRWGCRWLVWWHDWSLVSESEKWAIRGGLLKRWYFVPCMKNLTASRRHALMGRQRYALDRILNT